MMLDEALAVYAFLKDRAPGDRDEDEERAFRAAWRLICEQAIVAVSRHERQRITGAVR